MISRLLTIRLLITIGCLFALSLVGATIAAPNRSMMAQESTPPLLVSSEPAEGEAWAGGPITFQFDQPLDPSAAEALTIEPAITGTTTVEDDRLIFTPTAELEGNKRYEFTIGETLSSVAGTALGTPLTIAFNALAPLQVTSTQPSDGSIDVSTGSQIVVVFNRPVVPLTAAAEQSDLPHPLTIEPAVAGEGRWLNTSIYLFQPALGLAGTTEYQVTVDGLTGLQGETLAEPTIFRFSTAAPLVLDLAPQGEQVAPTQPVVVSFSQPMDPDSTNAAFSLTRIDNGEPVMVAGEFAWDALQTTLTFTPTDALEFGALYRARVAESAQPASRQGTVREAFEREFRVVPLPAIEVISPLDGATGVSPDANVTIRFSAPLSYTSVLANLQVSPTVTTTQVYSYYADYNREATISWLKQPNTTYTVTVGGEIVDLYGNTLGEDYTFHFTTGDYSPFTRINLDRFTHFSAITTTRVSLYYRNVDDVTVELFRVPTSEFLALSGTNQYELWQNYQIPDRAANRVWSQRFPATADPNTTGQEIITLTDEDGNPLPPGIYLLEVEQPTTTESAEPRSDATQALIVLSNYNLVLKKSPQGESLAWLTDLRTGEPVADQPVQFYVEMEQIAEAVTDAEGIARAELGLTPDTSYWPARAIVGEPGTEEFAAVSSEWNTGVAVWDFGLNGGYSVEQFQAYFYTDRPIYRPGQTVYWKGIVRVLEEDGYVLPPAGQTVEIVVRDDRGNSIAENTFELNENGTVNSQIELAPTAVTGYYYLEARLPIQRVESAGDRTVYGGVGFQVASYRRPEFQLELTSDKPEYVQGDTVNITLNASYFSGGALANAPITWRLIAEPYYFMWDAAPQHRFFNFTPYDPEQTEDNPYMGIYIGLLEEGSGTTDADGNFVIEIPADLQDALQSQLWAFDVTVQSPTNQFVSGRTAVPVHRGEFYIGLSPQENVVIVDEPSAVDLVTITPAGEPYPAAELTVIVYEYSWNSVYSRAADGSYFWETNVDRTPVLTTTATTDRQGSAQIEWTPARGGQYQLVASGTDDAGNPINSAIFVYASDPDQGFVAWPRTNNDRINLVADKERYEPGETAQILVPSPFTGTVQALLTLERGGIYEASVIELTGTSSLIEIPITAEQIPNIFVGVILVKGVDASNPLPAMRVGYVQLNIDTSQKALEIDVAASSQNVRPGDTVTYTLTVQDSAGDAVANAEVSVALVDQAVLSLASGDTRSLLDVFYYERPLGVTTGMLLAINKDRLSQQLSEGAKGGGGGDLGRGLEIRDDFLDVAYWQADLVTDEAGQLVFSVTLPDNLTTWTLAAKAVSTDTLVGDVTFATVSTKALQIRPRLPRFFTAGDRAQAGAVVLNTSDADAEDLRIEITASGATLGGAQILTTTLAAGAQQTIDLPLAVDADASTVVITMTAQSSELSDAVRIEIPVRRYETPEVIGTAGIVPAEGVVEAIRVPTDATEQGELTVTLEPSLAAGLLDGLNYLEHFPYECTEQTVSRFLPNLFTVRALRSLEIDHAELAEQLAYQLGMGVQRLVSRQNADGGWGYWPTEESSPFITAYVVWGLHHADEQGYAVPPRTLSMAISYLERQFVAPKDVEENWILNELAFLNFVLAETGNGDPGRASTLYDVRERLSHYGQALLAMTLAQLAEDGAENAQVATLLDDLAGAAQVSATGASWHEANIDFQTLNTDTRTTSMVLAAFVRLDPENPLLPNVVRWLMSAREAGHWATTQENSWAIIALTDWLAFSGELSGEYEWQVYLNEGDLGTGSVDAGTLAEPVTLRAAVVDLLRDEANRLTIERSNDNGQLYYTTHLRYYLDALAITAEDRGLVVDRRFEQAGTVVNSAQVGDVISVTVTIVAPTDLYHALIEVPIPAGVEPIDTSLATESDIYSDPSLTPTSQANDRWRFWTPSYTDLRDDRVALFATRLPAGTYEYTFQVRATIPGEYRVLPVYGEMMYFNEVWGRSTGAQFTVTE